MGALTRVPARARIGCAAVERAAGCLTNRPRGGPWGSAAARRRARRCSMAQTLSTGPRLSLAERDRRYAAIREQLRERGVDCLIVTGSDLFYLTNHLPGEQVGLLATDSDAPPTVQLNNRHLVDIS